MFWQNSGLLCFVSFITWWATFNYYIVFIPIRPNMTENFKRILFWLESYWTSNIWKINTKPLRWMIENVDLHCIFLLMRLWRNERAKKDIANISKLFCFNLGHPSLCRFFTDLYFVIIITWKLAEPNSQSFWEYGHYSLFFLFFFSIPVERSRL